MKYQITKLYKCSAVHFLEWPDLTDKELVGMIVRFMTDIPLWQRIKILWFGRIYVQADYRGQHEPLNIQIGAVNPRVSHEKNTTVRKSASGEKSDKGST